MAFRWVSEGNVLKKVGFVEESKINPCVSCAICTMYFACIQSVFCMYSGILLFVEPQEKKTMGAARTFKPTFRSLDWNHAQKLTSSLFFTR